MILRAAFALLLALFFSLSAACGDSEHSHGEEGHTHEEGENHSHEGDDHEHAEGDDHEHGSN